MRTVVLFVAELQHVVVLGVEVELFRQIAYLVVEREYQMELSSAFVHLFMQRHFFNWCKIQLHLEHNCLSIMFWAAGQLCL